MNDFEGWGNEQARDEQGPRSSLEGSHRLLHFKLEKLEGVWVFYRVKRVQPLMNSSSSHCIS